MKLVHIKAYFQYMKSPKGAYEWKYYGLVLAIIFMVCLVCVGAWLYGR